MGGTWRRRLDNLDELVIRIRDLVPAGDPLAAELWEDLSEDQRQVIRSAVYNGYPIDDPADAVVALALLDALARRRTAGRPRQIAVLAGVVLTAVIITVVLDPPNLAWVLLLLGGLLAVVGLGAVARRELLLRRRRQLDALAAAYRRWSG